MSGLKPKVYFVNVWREESGRQSIGYPRLSRREANHTRKVNTSAGSERVPVCLLKITLKPGVKLDGWP